MQIITPPDFEPVDSDEAKAAGRIDGSAHDLLIPIYIASARAMAEQVAGRALVAQTRRHTFRDWPGADQPIPEFSPTAVAVSYWNGAAWVSVAGVQFGAVKGGTVIDRADDWPTLPDYPGDRVRVDITSGDAPDVAPPELKNYIIASVAHWVNHPGAVLDDGRPVPNPLFERLLDGVKVYG